MQVRREHLNYLTDLSLPRIIKMTIEAVFVVLGEKNAEFREVRRHVRNIVPRMLAFDARKMTAAISKKLESGYLSNPDFTFERVNRASKPCGPMVKWILAQHSYFLVLQKIKPLLAHRAEVNKEIELATAKLIELQQRADQIRFEHCMLCM